MFETKRRRVNRKINFCVPENNQGVYMSHIECTAGNMQLEMYSTYSQFRLISQDF